MQQLLQGDSSSVFEIMYRSYQEPIERYLVTKIRDQEFAREICQDTFERFWNFLLSQETASQPAAYYKNWIYRTATNLAIDKHRRKKLIDFVALPEDEVYTQFAELRVEGNEDQVFDRLWLQDEVPQLSPQYRECLRLQLCGYPEKEIAAILGITEKTVSANVSRGKTELRRKYFPVMVDTVDLERAQASHAEQTITDLLRGVKGVINQKKLYEHAERAVDWQYRQYIKKHSSELRDNLLVNDPALQPNWAGHAEELGNSLCLTIDHKGRLAPINYALCELVTENENCSTL